MPIKIFLCYAHEDELLLKKLKTHLSSLQRQGLVDVWHDRDINAGTEWAREIDKHLNTAQIILLLVSPDFIVSDYCYGVEMKRAMERHESGEARVIPIILRPVYWQGTPFGKLQFLPTDAIPIIDPSWHNLDTAFYNVIQGILKATNELLLEQWLRAYKDDSDDAIVSAYQQIKSFPYLDSFTFTMSEKLRIFLALRTRTIKHSSQVDQDIAAFYMGKGYLSTGTRCFIRTKEDNKSEHCEDKCAWNDGLHRFAVADGVARSFLSGMWAQIITTRFVADRGNFDDMAEFEQWLIDCSKEWHEWVNTVWTPYTAKRLGARFNLRVVENEIQEGAKATFIGCSLLPKTNPLNKSVTIKVLVVGDATFFLLRPPTTWHDNWSYSTFPYYDAAEFSVLPRTLGTSPDSIHRSWKYVKIMDLTAVPGDYIVLATDALAKWILQMLSFKSNRWIYLLNITSIEEFKEFINQELMAGRIEEDDMTLLIVPISASS